MKKTFLMAILMTACQEPAPGPTLKVWPAMELPQIEEHSSFVKEGVWCARLYADDELTQNVENRALYIDINEDNEWFVWYQEIGNPGWPEAAAQLSILCNNQKDVPEWICEINGQHKHRWLEGSFRLVPGPDDGVTYIFMKEPGEKEKLLGGMLHSCPDDFPYISFDDRVEDLKKIREWLY